MTEPWLEKLARSAGLRVHWKDYRGRPRKVDEEVLQRVLAALGHDASSPARARASLARLQSEREAVPALLVGRCGRPLKLNAAALAALGGSEGPLELVSELEPPRSLVLQPDRGGGGRLSLPACQPGYHRLRGPRGELELALAPASLPSVVERTGRPRPWGMAAQLHSLYRPRDGGIGDWTAVAELARYCGEQGMDGLAISPTHAQFSADVHHYSPYSPSSRLFLNALHVDLAADFGSPTQQRWLLESGLLQCWQQLQDRPLIDWPTSAGLRLQLARHAWQQLTSAPAGWVELARDFQQFCQRGGRSLWEHACFESLQAWQLSLDPDRWHWQHWPEALQDPGSPAVVRHAEAHRQELDFHRFLQWQAHRGRQRAQHAARAAGMGLGLIADLAVGTSSGGSHAWSRQGQMLEGLTVGAPPDLINAQGQDWGLTTFCPLALSRHGYQPFIELLQANLAGVGGLRMDHVLGLARLWVVPEGVAAAQGVYLDYPCEDLMNLALLETWRQQAILIGEDLGTVPAGFRRTLSQSGVLGTRVLWFEQSDQGFVAPADWEPRAMATTSTHDLATVAGWWSGNDLDWRQRLGQFTDDQPAGEARAERARERTALWQALTQSRRARGAQPPPEQAEEVVDGALEYVATTASQLLLLPLEDLLGLREQPNLPGTVAAHPNWRRRLAGPATALLEEPAPARRLARIRHCRQGPGEGRS